MPTPSGISPSLLRNALIQLTGLDYGSGFDNSDILKTLEGSSGIQAVINLSEPLPFNVPDGTKQVQFQATTTAQTSATNAGFVTVASFTLPANKTGYVTYARGEMSNVGGSTRSQIRIYDGTSVLMLQERDVNNNTTAQPVVSGLMPFIIQPYTSSTTISLQISAVGGGGNETISGLIVGWYQ